MLALKGTPFPELLDHTAQVTAEGLRADFSKVLEYLPAEGCLVVRAGVGWPPGVVGVATVGADLASPAGFALRTGKPVISNHLENEERFRTPELLVENGIHRAMNVILQGDQQPYGVLEVDSRNEGEFEEHDIAFLQGAANLVGMAIERQRIERNLRAAVEQRDVLVQEIEHRVKNSLQLVISMLHLQASSVADESVRRQLRGGVQPHRRRGSGASASASGGRGAQARPEHLPRRAVRRSGGLGRCLHDRAPVRRAGAGLDRPGDPVGPDRDRAGHQRCEIRVPRRRRPDQGQPGVGCRSTQSDFRSRTTVSGCRLASTLPPAVASACALPGPWPSRLAPASSWLSARRAPSSRSPCRPNLRTTSEPRPRNARSPRYASDGANAGNAG